MTIIIGVGEPDRAVCKVIACSYPLEAKQSQEVLIPLLAVGVTYTVVTRVKPGLRYH
jgi:hypothetical protein